MVLARNTESRPHCDPMAPSGIETLVQLNARGEPYIPLHGSVISAS